MWDELTAYGAGLHPHGFCYLWQPGLLWLHVVSDSLITLAYYSIPLGLVYFVRKRRDAPFDWMFGMFAAFILACGTTHLLEVWTVWNPDYWLAGVVKATTAAVSVTTAIMMVPLLPKAIALPSPAQLRESEERFRSALYYSPIGMALVAPDGRWLEVNQALCRIVGYSEAELRATNFQSITHPDDLETDLDYVRQMLRGEIETYQMEKRYFHKDGHIIWILLSVSLLWSREGKPRYFISQIQDITERKQNEQALRRSEQRFRGVFNAMYQFIGLLSPEGIVLEINDTALAAGGLTATDVVGKPFREAPWWTVSPVIQERLGAAIVQAARGKFVRYEVELCGVGERLITIDFSLKPVFDDAGRVVQIIFEGRDITENKQARKALREYETQFHSIVSSMAEGIVMQDTDGAIIAANASAERLLGLTLEQMEGRTSLDPCWRAIHEDGSPFPGETHPPMVALWTGLAQTGVTMGLHRPEGTLIWLSINSQPMRHLADEPPYAVASVFHDITERKRVEQQILQLNSELESRVRERTAQLAAANQELEAFAYAVAHDLRAPLRGIDGFSQALLEDCAEVLDATGRDYLQRVRSGAQRMAQLIEDLLKLSRLSRAEMARQRVDVSALAWEVAAELQQREPARRVAWGIAAELAAEGDPRLLRVVLDNLLGNAWKFTRHRETARIEVGQTAGDEGTAFFVRDNGAGFDMAYADKLFAPFQRLHDAREFEGTGIGLATVQRVVRRHGGRVWAEAMPDQGATFYFTL